MEYLCKKCGEKITRDKSCYANPYLSDPLWVHLKNHAELYDVMMVFDNPNDIEDIYEKCGYT